MATKIDRAEAVKLFKALIKLVHPEIESWSDWERIRGELYYQARAWSLPPVPPENFKFTSVDEFYIDYFIREVFDYDTFTSKSNKLKIEKVDPDGGYGWSWLIFSWKPNYAFSFIDVPIKYFKLDYYYNSNGTVETDEFDLYLMERQEEVIVNYV